MAVREHAAFLTRHNSKCSDDAYIHFGTKDGHSNFATYDRRLGYDSTERWLALDVVRGDVATNNYERGLQINLGPNDDFFCHTGARKSWGVYIAGDRPDTAVMGGDANDMILRLGYTNYAVNTPAGSYARGLDISMTNRTAGTLSGLQGGFISVRQRSSGDCGSLEGLQIDCKIDSGMGAPTTDISGLRVELDLCANAPAESYGIVVRQRTDGVYTAPGAAFKAYNDGTSSCPGFLYGLDLFSSTTVGTVSRADIRLHSADASAVAAVIASGPGTSDATIVADIGADALYADGSIYIGVLDGAGTLWQKVNDTWTQIS